MAEQANPRKQARQVLQDSQNILLVIGQKASGDSIWSAVALALGLEKLGKSVSLACPSTLQKEFFYLPKLTDVHHTLEHNSNDFIISVNTQNAEIDKMKYTQGGETLDVILSLKNGSLNPSDIHFKQSNSHFDLIVAPSVTHKDELGALYNQNKELFDDTTVLVLDHHSHNSYFGDINYVDNTASATSELLVGVLEGLDPNLIGKDIATALLTWIITETASFKSQNTTPKAFSVAANLLGKGANQDTIIQYLYKQKELSKLKLWGKVLSNIVHDKPNAYVHSTAYKSDFLETETNFDDAKSILDDLLSSAADAEIITLFSENIDGSIGGVIYAHHKDIPAHKLARLLQGDGDETYAEFLLQGANIQDVQNFVHKKVSEFQIWRKGNTQSEANEQTKEIPKANEETSAAPQTAPTQEAATVNTNPQANPSPQAQASAPKPSEEIAFEGDSNETNSTASTSTPPQPEQAPKTSANDASAPSPHAEPEVFAAANTSMPNQESFVQSYPQPKAPSQGQQSFSQDNQPPVQEKAQAFAQNMPEPEASPQDQQSQNVPPKRSTNIGRVQKPDTQNHDSNAQNNPQTPNQNQEPPKKQGSAQEEEEIIFE